MGPLSFLKIFSGLWVTITSMGLQGIGISFVYIGTLLTMMGELEAFGLQNTDQSKGMVSSLWTCRSFLINKKIAPVKGAQVPKVGKCQRRLSQKPKFVVVFF